MKLVVNSLLGIGMQAIAEALVLGEKAGLDRNRLLEVLSQTAVVAPGKARSRSVRSLPARAARNVPVQCRRLRASDRLPATRARDRPVVCCGCRVARAERIRSSGDGLGQKIARATLAGAYAYTGKRDEAMDLLEQAFATHETELTWINYDPLLTQMANEPRFKRLLLKMKLPN